jgi:hypothetical protein
MGDRPRVGELEIEQDLDVQRREWRAEHVGWVVILLILVAAVAGLFGDGPLSRAEAASADGALHARYDRMERHGAPASITVEVRRAAMPGERFRLAVGQRFLGTVSLDGIDPAPARAFGDTSWAVYEFERPPRDDARIVFRFEPRELWTTDVAFALESRAPLRFRQFVFP